MLRMYISPQKDLLHKNHGLQDMTQTGIHGHTDDNWQLHLLVCQISKNVSEHKDLRS